MFPGPVKVSAVSLSLLLAWVIFPESSRAQYDQRAELAVGYSRLQFQPGGPAEEVSLDGWQAALTGYVRKWIGFTADFSGHYGSLDSSGAPLSADLNHFSYLFGPRARLLRTRLVSASILALFGASRGTLDASAGVFEGTVFSASVKQTKFAAAVGGAVDINLTRQVAWRVEPVYFLTSFGGERQNNFRFSTGIVYRFGTDWR